MGVQRSCVASVKLRAPLSFERKPQGNPCAAKQYPETSFTDMELATNLLASRSHPQKLTRWFTSMPGWKAQPSVALHVAKRSRFSRGAMTTAVVMKPLRPRLPAGAYGASRPSLEPACSLEAAVQQRESVVIIEGGYVGTSAARTFCPRQRHLTPSQPSQIARRIHNSAAHESHTPQASANSWPPSLLPSVLITATPKGVNR